MAIREKTAGGKPQSVPVSAFLDVAEGYLKTRLVGGRAGLKNPITETAINRPGLALTGFFEHFAHRRIQVLGLSEHKYLSLLDPGVRRVRLADFFKQHVPCVVMARNKKSLPEMEQLAEEYATPILRSEMVTKDFVTAATIVMDNLMAPRTIAQGTMMEIMGIGVLIEGKPGIGKSETALGLIRKGYALVSDDVTSLRLDSSGSVIATPVNITRYHMEIRGIGIIHVPSLFGISAIREEKKLDLVVTLCHPSESLKEDMEREKNLTRSLFGVDIPRLFLPVKAGRELANVVEAAALDFKLKRLGHDAAKELDQKLVRQMSEGKVGSE